ncbi:MAG: hypothetical protein D3915_15870 [Candidatus Electrothrix sp. AU1_5]|nr:hypothetical protein [Candidatus Electrothrix gigas]
MLQLNISQVKSHFSATIARVTAGETVIICNRNKPVAEIRPLLLSCLDQPARPAPKIPSFTGGWYCVQRLSAS